MFPPSALRRVRVLHADFVRAHPFPDFVPPTFLYIFWARGYWAWRKDFLNMLFLGLFWGCLDVGCLVAYDILESSG